MKQAITTENYKTTVNIPYSKIAKPCHQSYLPNSSNGKNDTVVYVSGSNCQKCECLGKSENVTMEMLE